MSWLLEVWYLFFTVVTFILAVILIIWLYRMFKESDGDLFVGLLGGKEK